ncbi:uncharacterized protein BJ171DRAFT_561043 [Polychytrium aggregatum]|uniref:uncharacterized protein n=1 Tax=Polychytrium aggregatum TaxID=110093 RepID=UPI0022FE31D4|nr:uncharacterized protein BJ171DRAFT_561043 [Polychytrium aggregatum]KAI9209486.1 hypothetical protein BJ171DRAFT_561043 [Polychytrium aggregatum]
MSFDPALVSSLSLKHPRPHNANFVYGTAGFRMKAELLDSVMFRVGILAVLRSKKLGGKVIGAMITASHNPEQDNGIKLVEPLGEMLLQSWEGYATRLANAATEADLVQAINEIIAAEQIDFGKLSTKANVVCARDTRPSGEALVAAVKDGVAALGGSIVDYGFKTTPHLHYITRCLNTQGTPDAYGVPTEEGYNDKLAAAFKTITAGLPRLSTLHLDAANGIGAPAFKKFLETIGSEHLSVHIVNDDIHSKGKLNSKCGADFVKLYQTKPEGLDLAPGQRAASFDGDADRLVYYYIDDNGTFKLLDGDKIATLAAGFIMEQVRIAKVQIHKPDGTKAPLHVGLVQTAYANGSSTSYVKNTLQVPVVFTQTGVKHLHHAAEHFDVGVYFEANGHGTVLFSKEATHAFKTTQGSTPEEHRALEILRALADLINQSVGDATSDLLMVEAILTVKQLSLSGWDKAYADLPSRQEKVLVAQRSIFKPINADTELAEPLGLQDKINQQVQKFNKGRCFVRPSGTEDIVRVYAEAETRDETETLSQIVCGIVFDGYGGVGERPAKFKKVDAAGNVVA